jgi:phosphoribosylformylglycinamidine synthase
MELKGHEHRICLWSENKVHRIERGRVILVKYLGPFEGTNVPFKDAIYDRMTENISVSEPDMKNMFSDGDRVPLEVVDIFTKDSTPIQVLRDYNRKRGLAPDKPEMEYLIQCYTNLERPSFDVELFIFAQVNSEHCRHKQFNANWTIDGTGMGETLFGMIKNTHLQNLKYTVSAYSEMRLYWKETGEVSGHQTTRWDLGRPRKRLCIISLKSRPIIILRQFLLSQGQQLTQVARLETKEPSVADQRPRRDSADSGYQTS